MTGEKFEFEIIDKNLNYTKNKDMQALFQKWYLNLQTFYFNFNKMASDMDVPNLLKHLLEDETVLKTINVRLETFFVHCNRVQAKTANPTKSGVRSKAHPTHLFGQFTRIERISAYTQPTHLILV